MRFTSDRLTNLRIFKLRVYFEKLIGRQSRCSGWSGGQGESSEWIECGEWGERGEQGERGKWDEFYEFRNFNEHLVPKQHKNTNLLLTGYMNASR